ncbi:nucleotidyltransferase domain-containing protein [Mycobacterium sp. M1]|uniref:Nucleotidyltransferase domain-containing protein n=1 Tax=Mycolicibacter acidiphilus TaxID=2835306 RepID=A0ABS5RHW1_9MYCO|nr:nucleotidyltransferase domain-containing protein [Mycolicibacter acidiphilus]MBS9533855.1 nucleotidyltransferase domain-containing protein [Mycolicibacter acidiphilus]
MSLQTTDGETVLRDVVAEATAKIGDRLAAVYAMGSLAHGGFSPAVSDVDVAVILTGPPQPGDHELVQGVIDAVQAVGSPLHQRLSIFWGTTESLRGDATAGRFPPLDRLCLFEHGRLLAGTDVRGDLPRPSQTELLVAGAQFAADLLAEPVITASADPAALLERGVRPATKLVLFPTRFLFTADTRREGTNDAAAQHYSEHHRGPAAELVAAAYRWRTADPGPDAPALLNAGFTPLYTDYLSDHITRLTVLGETRLADRFAQWRSQLSAD